MLKSNRQIGLDGRVFISDCLSDGIFFVYSIILGGLLGAAGDIMKLLGKSRVSMDPAVNPLASGHINALILMDLVCCLGLVVVSYYVYFMNCGENMPKLGVKPLIILEYVRLGYYGLLIYDVLYRFAYETMHREVYPVAMTVFYCVYLGWLVTCVFAAMFILTVLNQNMIRRSYSGSLMILAVCGLIINIAMPITFFISKVWVSGGGDGFYSSGICDFIRLGIAPIFYAALWFIFLNAIDQVNRVFGEVDNAIRDKRYRIEFEETESSGKKSRATSSDNEKKSFWGRKKINGKKKDSHPDPDTSRGVVTDKEDVALPEQPEEDYGEVTIDVDALFGDAEEEKNGEVQDAEAQVPGTSEPGAGDSVETPEPEPEEKSAGEETSDQGKAE